MSTKSDERLLEAFESVPAEDLIGRLQAVAEAAVRAEREGAAPVAYIHRHGNHYEVAERFLNDDEKARGWTEEPLYTHPPQASATVPEGMVLVPVKPTERMLDHAVAFALNVGPAQSGGWTEYARRMWETMVIAAASQPGDEKEGCGYTCPGRGACKAQEGT